MRAIISAYILPEFVSGAGVWIRRCVIRAIVATMSAVILIYGGAKGRHQSCSASGRRTRPRDWLRRVFYLSLAVC